MEILDHVVDGTESRTNACSSTVLEPTLCSVALDYPNVYWLSTNGSQIQDEKLALIQEIVDAMPEVELIPILYEVFVTRCQGPLGNVVHTPTFMNQADEFCACLGLVSPEARVMSLSSKFAMDILACHLLAVSMPLYRPSSVCSRTLF